MFDFFEHRTTELVKHTVHLQTHEIISMFNTQS